MSTTKKITGDYTISPTGSVIITSNLVVNGTTTTVNTTETTISDRVITLNEGEFSYGVSGVYSGVEVDRGQAEDVAVRWNEGTLKWEVGNEVDGSVVWSGIATDADLTGYLQNVVEDLTPQLGGNLDVNGKTITSATNGNIVIDPDGTGLLKIDAPITLQDQASAPTATSGYNKIYSSATQGGGASGVYFVNSTKSDELASRTRAILYGLIF